MDLHNYKQRLKRQLELAQAETKISPVNKKQIFKFKDYLLSEGIGIAKIARYMIDARKFGFKSFK